MQAGDALQGGDERRRIGEITAYDLDTVGKVGLGRIAGQGGRCGRG